MASIKVDIFQAYYEGRPWKCYTESSCLALDKLEPELNVGQFDYENDYRPNHIRLAGVIAKAVHDLQEVDKSLTIVMCHNEQRVSRKHGLNGKLTKLVPLSDDEIAEFDEEFERIHAMCRRCD